MQRRYVTIWFPHLQTDWFVRRNPELKDKAFVLCAPDHGRMIVTAANTGAAAQGVYIGITVADARALVSHLEVLDEEPGVAEKLLNNIAAWCIRFTPLVAVSLPGALILDASGCAHLWGGEEKYMNAVILRFRKLGYHIRAAMASTIGLSHALAHFSNTHRIAKTGDEKKELDLLPPAALRILPEATERLQKLGLTTIKNFATMPRHALRRRFGAEILQRLDQALGVAEEFMTAVQPPEPYHEFLPCIEPILTATGISIALEQTIHSICKRLQRESKGLRIAVFKCYRVDGKLIQIQIGTNKPSANATHLLKLFSEKIESIEPGEGIELFTLDALRVEEYEAPQNELWANRHEDDTALAELLDRIGGKLGEKNIARWLPAAHYWPERSFEKAIDLRSTSVTTWKIDRPRPVHLFDVPQLIIVTAPVPDYPPMNFRYRGKLHRIVKADGPERIEQEWWLQEGLHRDYYAVEDEEGHRYWLYRAGHYDAEKKVQWFLHGMFA